MKRTIVTLVALLAAGVFLWGGTAALPFDDQPDRLKYVSVAASPAVTIRCGQEQAVFPLPEGESNSRGVRMLPAVEALRLIAEEQGFGEAVAVGFVYPKTLLAIERWLTAEADRAPIDATAERGNPFVYREGRDGVRADRHALYRLLYRAALAGGGDIEVPTETLPAQTVADLKRETVFRSSFATSYASSSADRKHNVQLALSNFDCLRVAPGETVSFNAVVGPRTEDRGYRTSKIIFQGRYVDGVGGGVCQVSTTLYNALVLGGMEILEVHAHSLAPSYVSPSRDAMVNAGSADLVFRNPCDRAVRFRVYGNDEIVRVSLFGEAPRAKYAIESVVLETVEAGYTEREDDGTFESLVRYDTDRAVVRYPHDGVTSEAYLSVETADGTVRKRIRRNVYAPADGEIVYGREKRTGINGGQDE